MRFPLLPFSTSTQNLRPYLALKEAERESMTFFLQNLIRTPSPSTQEQDVAALIQKELRSVGVEDVFVDRAGNVIGRLGDGNGPTLLLDAHMDTVQPAATDWPHDPYAAVIQDGVIYGLGACDMKGAIAAMVYAAGRLIGAHVPLHGTLVLAFVVQEEPCEGYALKVLIEEEGIRPDWVVLGEPSDLQIVRGHRGRVLYKVTVQGRSSHASRPELGDNAIMAAARLIFGIDLLTDEMGDDPFLGPGSITVTHIQSQSASLNAIPDTCSFYVDRRLTLGETATRAQAQIEGIIQRESIHATVEVVEYQATSYKGYPFFGRQAFNSWTLEENHPLLQTLSTIVRAVQGRNPTIGTWAISTDGAYSMGEANIPTVGFGPGKPEHAHTVYDQVRLDDVAQAAQVYAMLAEKLLGSNR
jgi:putative selenium metabolism hydrolase